MNLKNLDRDFDVTDYDPKADLRPQDGAVPYTGKTGDEFGILDNYYREADYMKELGFVRTKDSRFGREGVVFEADELIDNAPLYVVFPYSLVDFQNYFIVEWKNEYIEARSLVSALNMLRSTLKEHNII